MSEKHPGEGHPKAKLAGEIAAGATVVAAGAIGTTAFLHMQRQRAETRRQYDPVMSAHYEHSLEVFRKVRPELAQVMAAMAVRIHAATEHSNEGVVSRDQLMEQLNGLPDPLYHISRSVFDNAIGRLKDNMLVERRPMATNRRSLGYASLPALRWGLEGNPLDVLVQAQEQYAELNNPGTPAEPAPDDALVIKDEGE